MKTITITNTTTCTTETQEVFDYMSTQDVRKWFDNNHSGSSKKVCMVFLDELQVVTLNKYGSKLIVDYMKTGHVQIDESIIEQYLGVKSY